MARARRTTRSRGYERKITHREWFVVSGVESFNLANNADVNIRKLFNEELRGDDCTILRTRGLVYVECPDVATGVGVNMVMGMTHLPAKFSGLADSMLPNPLNETESDDWFLWLPLVAQTDVGDSGMTIDSKAMRKMPADYQAYGVLGYKSSGAPGATIGCVVTYTLRVLVGY